MDNDSDPVPETGTVTTSRLGNVATIVLTQPALNQASKQQLLAALLEVGSDASVRAVTVTGTGRSFCVGQDLAEHTEALTASAAHAFDTVDLHYAPIVRALTTMPKPVVAAVNGTCVGAGLALALACDLRVFAAGARLGTAFTGIGLTCDSGLSVTLVRAVGASRAAQLLLLGSLFTPEDAVAWGVGGQITEPAEVADTADRLAHQLAAGPTAAFAETKRLLASAASGASLEQALADESAAQHRLGLTSDHQDAVTAFLSKGRPAFTGS